MASSRKIQKGDIKMRLVSRFLMKQRLSLRKLLTPEEKDMLRDFRKAFPRKKKIPEIPLLHYFIHEREELWEAYPILRKIDFYRFHSTPTFRLFVDHRKEIMSQILHEAIRDPHKMSNLQFA